MCRRATVWDIQFPGGEVDQQAFPPFQVLLDISSIDLLQLTNLFTKMLYTFVSLLEFFWSITLDCTMKRIHRLVLGLFVTFTSAFGILITGVFGQTTVTFQHGLNGYVGGDEIRISMTGTRDGTNGYAVNQYLIDGWQTDDPETAPIESDSPDEQELIQFPNIIGAGAIPQGATILDAKLIYRTYSSGTTANSPGPFGVAALLQPFTTATRYADFPSSNGPPPTFSRGAWWQDGYATRSTGGFAGPHTPPVGADPGTGTNTFGGIVKADVFPLVQGWANDPNTNHGFVVQAGWTGQTNGWGFFTNGAGTASGAGVAEDRPKLEVTYTTSPVGITSFQRDVNSYTGDVVARLDSGADINGSGDDITIDGTTVTGAYYIDSNDAGTDPRLRTLVRFNNVFGNGAGQAPSDKSVLKAWVVMTTGNSDNNRAPGPVSVHPMLRNWDTTSVYSNIGDAPGLTEADGDIGPVLDANYGMINGSQSWFDVTSYLEGVRNGATDYGLAFIANTNDGWATFLNGATDPSVRPRLVVYSDLSAPPAGVPGDYNNNGTVDAADYVLWRKGSQLQNEVDTPGTINSADYAAWRQRFGSTPAGSGGAVPEPTTAILGIIAALSCGAYRKR